jgi:hypothetical protein
MFGLLLRVVIFWSDFIKRFCRRTPSAGSSDDEEEAEEEDDDEEEEEDGDDDDEEEEVKELAGTRVGVVELSVLVGSIIMI